MHHGLSNVILKVSIVWRKKRRNVVKDQILPQLSIKCSCLNWKHPQDLKPWVKQCNFKFPLSDERRVGRNVVKDQILPPPLNKVLLKTSSGSQTRSRDLRTRSPYYYSEIIPTNSSKIVSCYIYSPKGEHLFKSLGELYDTYCKVKCQMVVNNLKQQCWMKLKRWSNFVFQRIS